MAISWKTQIGREAKWWFSHVYPHIAIISHADWFKYIYKLYCSSIHNLPFEKALEIGPGGSGGYLPLIKNIGKRYAVEPIADQLRTKGFLPYDGQIEYHNCFAEEMPFENDTFDLIVITNALDHVENVEKVLAEMNRVLKKDGHILFFTYLSVKKPHPTTWYSPEEARALFKDYDCLESHFIKSTHALDTPRNDYYVAIFKK
jgi:SAM-dependent methyltransferase